MAPRNRRLQPQNRGKPRQTGIEIAPIIPSNCRPGVGAAVAAPAGAKARSRGAGAYKRPNRGASMASVAIRDVRKAFGATEVIHGVDVNIGDGEFVVLVGARKREIELRVNGAADILGLRALLGRYPRQLSGGQRQRVAMGRAIVRDPQVFLFDEPLSNLDAKLRVAMRTEIKELHQRLKTTTIYVTHDQIEAMTLADRIVVMHDGLVEQIGAPLELYDRPRNLFVAGFIGSPAMNFLKGTIRRNGALQFEAASGVRLPLVAAPTGSDGRPVIYGIGPEHFVIAEDGGEAEVLVVEPTGSELQVVAKIGHEDIIAVFRERHDFKPGDKIRLKPDPRLAHLFDAPTGQRLTASWGRKAS